ncbi:BamA/TamA family outer membrane protein [Pendulispora rubella]|uniref:BamA/TamA family outer membrane protein n=1 Tax=Pendulispora rubella TaxID=2741070 RepID=A0ABZ2LE60_9BACT
MITSPLTPRRTPLARVTWKPLLAGLKSLACFFVLFANAAEAHAEEEKSGKAAKDWEASKEDPRRWEFLPVPNIGGNSDVGLELGVAFGIVRFYDDAKPYKWLLGGVFITSFKDEDGHFRTVQQFHALRLDVPGLFGGRVRINTIVNFGRNVIARWNGLGNASTLEGLPPGPDRARQGQFTSEQVRLRSVVRVKTGTPFDAAFSTNLRYEFPSIYEGSKIQYDAAHAGIPGTEPAFLTTLATGFIVDTRDNEFAPHRGVYYQAGIGGTVGSAERVAYGETFASLSSFIPLGNKLTFFNRVVASYQFGRVPFYDLAQGNAFLPQAMVGGDRGVRGVPGARYAGHVKMMANYELRSTLIPRFRVLRWKLQVGNTAFLDLGRVWNDINSSASDGKTPGIHYGVGGGFFFQWDRTSVFRVEMAYSPSDHPRNGFPLSYYIANGLTF